MTTGLRSRVAVFGLAVVWASLAFVEPAGAHGLGDGEGLGVSPFLLAGTAGALVLVAAAWVRDRGAPHPRPRLQLPNGLDRAIDILLFAARIAAAAVYVIVIAAAFDGSRFAVLNVTPWIVYIGLGLALPVLSFLFGDLWRAVSPLRTLALAASALGTAAGIRRDAHLSDWPAAISLAGFVWLEFAYHDPASPRVLAWLIVGYSAWSVVPATVLGVEWTDRADGLGWWYSAIASTSPWGHDGTRHFRAPFVAAAGEARPWAAVGLIAIIGGTAFDGVSRTSWWSDLVGDRFGWDASLYATLGLAWTVAVTALVYAAATRRGTAPHRHAPVLIPVALSWTLAHGLASLIFDGQTLLIRASDPFGDGSNWFGTADWIENTRAVSHVVIGWVAVGFLATAHVGAVLISQRITESRGGERRVGDALVVALIVYAVLGIILLVD